MAANDAFHPLVSTAPFTLDVLANDMDADADPLTLTGIAAAPAHGAAVINGNAVVYTPDGTFAGSDLFTYTVWMGTPARHRHRSHWQYATRGSARLCDVGDGAPITRFRAGQ